MMDNGQGGTRLRNTALCDIRPYSGTLLSHGSIFLDSPIHGYFCGQMMLK